VNGDVGKYLETIMGDMVMAKMKTIRIAAKSGEDFKVEVRAGKHTFYVDQPEYAGGSDAGPNPLEYFGASLAGCIATTARIVANQKNIRLHGIGMKIAGDFDAGRLLGKGQDNRSGYTGLQVELDIDADMTAQQKEDFVEEIRFRAPVFDNISNPTSLIISCR
jgi:uncharacterized OsmC-like protein